MKRQRGFYNCGRLKQQEPKHSWWREVKIGSDLRSIMKDSRDWINEWKCATISLRCKQNGVIGRVSTGKIWKLAVIFLIVTILMMSDFLKSINPTPGFSFDYTHILAHLLKHFYWIFFLMAANVMSNCHLIFRQNILILFQFLKYMSTHIEDTRTRIEQCYSNF